MTPEQEAWKRLQDAAAAELERQRAEKAEADNQGGAE